MERIRVGIAAAAFFMAALAGYVLEKPAAAVPGETGQQSSPAQAEETGQSGSAPAIKGRRFVANIDPDGIQRVEITGGSYYFDPDYIVLKVNVPVELRVRKTGVIPHNIIVRAPEAGIDFNLDLAKGARLVTFTPTKTGRYEMQCDKRLLFFKSHKDRGMDGWIEVVP